MKTKSPREVEAAAAGLLAVGDAALFTAGTLLDEAHEPSCQGYDQITLLAVANGYKVFARICTEMGLRLEDELAPTTSR